MKEVSSLTVFSSEKVNFLLNKLSKIAKSHLGT